MKRVVPLALVCVVALAGCAMPRWVPYFGDKASKKEEARLARGAPRPSLPNAPAETPAEKKEPREHISLRPEDNVSDRVVAVVNNDAITLGELQENVAVYRHENRGATNESDEQIASKFLNHLIDNRLQLQEADREKITAEEIEINEELADRVKKIGAKSTEEFEAMVRAQGVSMDAIRKRLRDNIRVAKVVRRKVWLRVTVTDPEIDKYFEENRQKLETGLGYHARHILVVPEGTTDEAWAAAKARADDIRSQLTNGADFAELARQYSGDATATDGGDLGAMKRGELAADIERQILTLAPGELSQPYRSTLGYHIFRLESKESLDGEGLVRVRQQIRDILFREKYERRLDAWLKEIKQRAIIEVRM